MAEEREFGWDDEIENDNEFRFWIQFIIIDQFCHTLTA